MTSAEKMSELEGRVHQFMCLQLPGQPQGMHMGTSYLVSELWAEVKNLRSELQATLAKDDDLDPYDLSRGGGLPALRRG